MNHLAIIPVLLPAFTAMALLLGARIDQVTKRSVSLLSVLALVGVSIALMTQASAETVVYYLGDWPAPFGIVLVLDRLAALMVSLTTAVGLGAVLFASRGLDLRGQNFHALLHFQLMGLNGAFLTGDIFNLFVFFEILLIASYGLMLHGGGKERIGAGLHYVILNLGGSAFFVIGLGMVYGALGTLNMADLALQVQAVEPGLQAVVQAAAMLLLVVFGLKAALLPLYFWLPRTYGSTSAPVAALFAIMTKVGVYAIIRVYTLVFPNTAPVMDGLPGKVLVPAALATIVFATLGAMAAKDLKALIANLLIASVGVMMTAVGLFTEASLAAGLYYMVHSTLVVAALFLIAAMIADERGSVAGALRPAPQVAHAAVLGTLFFVCAAAIGGLPPFGGFLGKVYVLRSAVDAPGIAWIWGIILGGSLFSLLALARAGSAVFWKTVDAVGVDPADAAAAEVPHDEESHYGPVPSGAVAATLLVVLMTGVAVLAGPLGGYVDQTAAQLANPEGYIELVLGGDGTGEVAQ
jgi:multicomponent K+:H+ antiporter subunit D